jgi:hypothetical protein
VLFGGVLGIAVLMFWIWAIFDVITSDRERCRNLPKLAWALIVILLGVIGAVVWILLGRPERAHAARGPAQPSARRPAPRPIAPEDRSDWSAAPSTSPSSRRRSEELDRRLAEWEAEQQRRDRPGAGGPGPGPEAPPES